MTDQSTTEAAAATHERVRLYAGKPTLRSRIVALADGTLQPLEIAERAGASPEYVRRVLFLERKSGGNVPYFRPPPGRGHSGVFRVPRDTAAFYAAAAEERGMTVSGLVADLLRNICQSDLIKAIRDE